MDKVLTPVGKLIAVILVGLGILLPLSLGVLIPLGWFVG